MNSTTASCNGMRYYIIDEEKILTSIQDLVEWWATLYNYDHTRSTKRFLQPRIQVLGKFTDAVMDTSVLIAEIIVHFHSHIRCTCAVEE